MAQRWPRGRDDGLTEAVVQHRIRAAYAAVRITVNDLSQGRPTRQPMGLPDLLCWHTESQVVFFVEVKRPYIRGVQRQGLRSWEQAEWHRDAQAAGIHVATVDSCELALAYAAYLGVPLPAGAFRQLYDPAQEARFIDPHAQPRLLQPRRGRSQARGPAFPQFAQEIDA